MNGPSGRSLDDSYLTPLGITRKDAWLCDMVPHSCQNAGQAKAIQQEYVPLIKRHRLPEVTVPPVPKLLCDDTRRAEILAELQESKAELVILLGDEPISWFLQAFDQRYARLRSFGDTPDTYGLEHTVSIAGKDYRVLPLVHPRQAAKLGAHSSEWYGLHQDWLTRMSRRK
jgi:uracil-DNA glycosylase